MTVGLACNSCGRRINDLAGACAICGREPDGVRADIQKRVELLLRRHTALLTSIDLYAAYHRALIEQELRSFGVDPADRPPLSEASREGAGVELGSRG